MPEKDPLNYAMLTYFWVIGIACWGGIAGYIRKLKAGHTERFKIAELIGEMVISSFVGIITFFMCEMAHFDHIVAAALVGITGHMGSRAIFIMEDIAAKKIKAFTEK